MAAEATHGSDAAAVALRFCDDEYPAATTIVMGGSSSTGHRTPSSDIDILVIIASRTLGDRGNSTASEARVVHREGERIDVFAYTPEAYRDWSERDFASLRPVLPFLLTEGTPLRRGDEFDELRTWSTDRLTQGPRITAHDEELRRYAITDLIDDLADATDPLSVATIRADLLRSLAELALLHSNSWLGSGKWLARRLRAADERAADALTAFAREPEPVDAARIASRLLDTLGGRVDDDMVR